MPNVIAFPSKPPVLSHREQLLAYCELWEFPSEQYYNEEFGAVTLEKAGHDLLTAMFTMFGVTELDPSGEDFETVANTWHELHSIGTDIRARHLFYDWVYVIDSKTWHPAYLAYIEALWDGDQAGVIAGAKALGIQHGIPEDSPHPQKGPLPGPAKK